MALFRALYQHDCSIRFDLALPRLAKTEGFRGFRERSCLLFFCINKQAYGGAAPAYRPAAERRGRGLYRIGSRVLSSP